MELALFTPGAYIWPVYRNFEAFIAALGAPVADAGELAAATIYPARRHADTVAHGLPGALDRRLALLHRDLHNALLRPAAQFKGKRQSFADCFWPDLADSAIDQLLSAFVYYFIRRSASDIPVETGLSVLRSVFFNHENIAPTLWLQSAMDRLASYRPSRQTRMLKFAAPASAKHHNLEFVVTTDSRRPAGGPGWLPGRAQRQTDGSCLVNVEYALGPSLEGVLAPNQVLTRLDNQARQALAAVFGWAREEAA